MAGQFVQLGLHGALHVLLGHTPVIHVLCLVLLVPLWARAAPPEVEARLRVLEPVGVSEYQGNQGHGLRLTSAAAVASAGAVTRTTGACAESKKSDNQAHHLCTNKNDTSEISGGPWTPLFEDLFARAGMSLDDPANIVYLRGHKGPHSKEYHEEIFDRLERAIGTCRTPDV